MFPTANQEPTAADVEKYGNFGAWLRLKRRARFRSMSAFWEALKDLGVNVTSKAVEAWEQGTHPGKSRTVNAIADLLWDGDRVAVLSLLDLDEGDAVARERREHEETRAKLDDARAECARHRAEVERLRAVVAERGDVAVLREAARLGASMVTDRRVQKAEACLTIEVRRLASASGRGAEVVEAFVAVVAEACEDESSGATLADALLTFRAIGDAKARRAAMEAIGPVLRAVGACAPASRGDMIEDRRLGRAHTAVRQLQVEALFGKYGFYIPPHEVRRLADEHEGIRDVCQPDPGPRFTNPPVEPPASIEPARIVLVPEADEQG